MDPENVQQERRIARSLKRLARLAYEARARDDFDRINPIPYFAPYFDYKGHIDQNENIAQEYGCTHVALIDGCSRMICGYAYMDMNPRLCFPSCNFKVQAMESFKN